jgi:hypothetical protein
MTDATHLWYAVSSKEPRKRRRSTMSLLRFLYSLLHTKIVAIVNDTLCSDGKRAIIIVIVQSSLSALFLTYIQL